MISIAIVEDDDSCAGIISGYLQRYTKEYGDEFTVKRFPDGYAIVDGYRGGYDIILMDIEMGLMNGMEAAKEIRRTDNEVIIIFITNMAQYAIQGYSVRALDYVLKPISYAAFSQAIRRAIGGLDRAQEKYIMVSGKDFAVKLKTDHIYWIESRGHQITFHAQSEDYMTTVYSMKELEEKLSGAGFMRASSGMLVNLKKVTGTKAGCIEVDGQHIPLSRGQRAKFMSALVSYMTR